jgi:hypothetical protein
MAGFAAALLLLVVSRAVSGQTVLIVPDSSGLPAATSSRSPSGELRVQYTRPQPRQPREAWRIMARATHQCAAGDSVTLRLEAAATAATSVRFVVWDAANRKEVVNKPVALAEAWTELAPLNAWQCPGSGAYQLQLQCGAAPPGNYTIRPFNLTVVKSTGRAMELARQATSDLGCGCRWRMPADQHG